MPKIIFYLLLTHHFCIAQTTTTGLNMIYNKSNNYYEVWLKTSETANFSIGTSVVSIILPSVEVNQTLTIESFNGGAWSDANKNYDVGDKDFHGIVTNGQSDITYSVGTDILLFRFTLSTTCKEGIRLWEQDRDVAETPDGTEYISNFYFPAHHDYSLPSVNSAVISCCNPNVSPYSIIKN
jgi:hypothetical protein